MAAKISLFVSGCGCCRRISRIAARGPVIFRACWRKRPVSADSSCRLWEWGCGRAFIFETAFFMLRSGLQMEKKNQGGNRAETGGEICKHEFFMMLENFAQHGVGGQI